MARRKKKSSGGDGMGWLVTFSDLMTLLLTFFVLLLSMASMDKSVVREITSIFHREIGFLSVKNAGQVETRYEIAKDLILNPLDVLNKEKRIKDLLFPDDVLPPEINKSTLDENLKVLLRPEGVALVLTDGILFETGQTELTDAARQVLGELVKFILVVPAAVNVAGYTDSMPAFDPDNFQISSERALSVLNFFVNVRIDPRRFSVSAYGPEHPVADNDTREGRSENRRVEILFKTRSSPYM